MKKVGFFISLFFLLVCQAIPLKAIDYTVKTIPNVRLSDRLNHVSNPDNIISAADVDSINMCLNALEDSNGVQVAVVAVVSVGDVDPEEFKTDLFNEWHLGVKKKDNGLLMLFVADTIRPNQRGIYFETGYGLEGVLPDATCYKLQQIYMVPVMRKGQYSKGMLEGVRAVSTYLQANDELRANMIGSDDDFSWTSFLTGTGIVGGLIALFVWIFRLIKYHTRICPNCKQRQLKFINKKITTPATYSHSGVKTDFWRCANCGHTIRKEHTIAKLYRDSGGGTGGGFFGGSSGGGFSGGGSWGGGSSGGGGGSSHF